MIIALAQLNYKVGDIDYNLKKISDTINQAKKEKVELIIFSELAITGYSPVDLLYNKSFVEKSIEKLHELSKLCDDMTVIIGGPSISETSKGKAIFNSAWMLHNGVAKAVAHKTLLPTDGLINEYRYFQPNDNFKVIAINGKRVAITIGEDLWLDKNSEKWRKKNQQNHLSPIQKLSALKPDFIINIDAKQFAYDKIEENNIFILERAKKYQLPIYYVNQVGGNAQLIYDGSSKIISDKGEIIFQMPFFEEKIEIVDNNNLKTISLKDEEEISLIHKALIIGIKDFFKKSGFKKTVLGLSGGLDSALAAALAVEALGSENVFGILMPSQFSTDHSITDAVDLAKNLNISYEIIPIKELFQSFKESLKNIFNNKPEDLTEENIQARIRGTMLMAYSNKFGHILLNTSNKSESAVGYGTLYGDMNGSLSVIGDLYKTKAFELAKYINREKDIIPINTITKPPSAELSENQKDSDSLPDYDILDSILFNFIEKGKTSANIIDEGYDSQLVERIEKLLNNSDFKRFQLPPVLQISSMPLRSNRNYSLVGKTLQS